MQLSSKEQARLKSSYGEWAVITGASSGIGRELAYQVGQSGLNLIIAARNEIALEQIKEDLENDHPIQVQVVVADLGQQEYSTVIEASNGKKIGLFIASAGFGTSGEFIQNSIHAESNMLQVNCDALLHLTHYFAQKFAAQQRGGIILLSSMVAFQGVPYSANYAATKAYVQSLAEGLYHELKPKGVDVLAAAPGPVKTAFEERANMNMDMSLSPAQVTAPILQALGRKMTVLPGGLTKLLVYALRTVPRWGKISIMKMVMGGMTAHQRQNA